MNYKFFTLGERYELFRFFISLLIENELKGFDNLSEKIVKLGYGEDEAENIEEKLRNLLRINIKRDETYMKVPINPDSTTLELDCAEAFRSTNLYKLLASIYNVKDGYIPVDERNIIGDIRNWDEMILYLTKNKIKEFLNVDDVKKSDKFDDVSRAFVPLIYLRIFDLTTKSQSSFFDILNKLKRTSSTLYGGEYRYLNLENEDFHDELYEKVLRSFNELLGKHDIYELLGVTDKDDKFLDIIPIRKRGTYEGLSVLDSIKYKDTKHKSISKDGDRELRGPALLISKYYAKTINGSFIESIFFLKTRYILLEKDFIVLHNVKLKKEDQSENLTKEKEFDIVIIPPPNDPMFDGIYFLEIKKSPEENLEEDLRKKEEFLEEVRMKNYYIKVVTLNELDEFEQKLKDILLQKS